jgi:hypothetical protein
MTLEKHNNFVINNKFKEEEILRLKKTFKFSMRSWKYAFNKF